MQSHGIIPRARIMAEFGNDPNRSTLLAAAASRAVAVSCQDRRQPRLDGKLSQRRWIAMMARWTAKNAPIVATNHGECAPATAPTVISSTAMTAVTR
jgi:hypothetical protein